MFLERQELTRFLRDRHRAAEGGWHDRHAPSGTGFRSTEKAPRTLLDAFGTEGKTGALARRVRSCVVFTPSIVPSSDDTAYVVEDDFGAKLGACTGRPIPRGATEKRRCTIYPPVNITIRSGYRIQHARGMGAGCVL
jgi:hypothetical protein